MPRENVYSEDYDETGRRAAVTWGGALSGDLFLATERQGGDAGVPVKLSRNSVNALIRTLRHARDKAFGRDE